MKPKYLCSTPAIVKEGQGGFRCKYLIFSILTLLSTYSISKINPSNPGSTFGGNMAIRS